MRLPSHYAIASHRDLVMYRLGINEDGPVWVLASASKQRVYKWYFERGPVLGWLIHVAGLDAQDAESRLANAEAWVARVLACPCT